MKVIIKKKTIKAQTNRIIIMNRVDFKISYMQKGCSMHEKHKANQQLQEKEKEKRNRKKKQQISYKREENYEMNSNN